MFQLYPKLLDVTTTGLEIGMENLSVATCTDTVDLVDF